MHFNNKPPGIMVINIPKKNNDDLANKQQHIIYLDSLIQYNWLIVTNFIHCWIRFHIIVNLFLTHMYVNTQQVSLLRGEEKRVGCVSSYRVLSFEQGCPTSRISYSTFNTFFLWYATDIVFGAFKRHLLCTIIHVFDLQ